MKPIREIEINQKKLRAFEEGHLISDISDKTERGISEILSSYRLPLNKEWVLQMRGSHRRVIILEWCMSTMVICGKDTEGLIDEVSMLLPRNDLEYDILKKTKLFFMNLTPEQIWDFAHENGQSVALYDLARKIHYGYTPQIDFTKLWDPIRVKPKPYIGVGYTDKGHLGDSPSWQSQMISADDGTIPNTRAFFDMILSL
jgi:hypothetical protein